MWTYTAFIKTNDYSNENSQFEHFIIKSSLIQKQAVFKRNGVVYLCVLLFCAKRNKRNKEYHNPLTSQRKQCLLKSWTTSVKFLKHFFESLLCQIIAVDLSASLSWISRSATCQPWIQIFRSLEAHSVMFTEPVYHARSERVRNSAQIRCNIQIAAIYISIKDLMCFKPTFHTPFHHHQQHQQLTYVYAGQVRVSVPQKSSPVWFFWELNLSGVIKGEGRL